MQIRQGDVYLVPASFAVDDLGGAVPPTNGTIVLAWGESTGHRHRFDGGVALYEAPYGRYLQVLEAATAIVRATSVERFGADQIRVRDSDETMIRLHAERLAEIEAAIKQAVALTYRGSLLRHEEHDAIIVLPGLYRLPSQREYTGTRLAPSRVSD